MMIGVLGHKKISNENLVFVQEEIMNEVMTQVALSFVFLMSPMPAKKKMAPTTPVKIMILIFFVSVPPFIKLKPA